MSITINCFAEEDIPGMHHEIRNSHGFLKELGWIENALYPDFKNHYRQILQMKDIQIFTVRVDGQVAGAVEVELKNDSHFIGYWLGRQYRGKGIITRCIQDIIANDLRDQLPLTSRVEVANTKSHAVLKRLGFAETSRSAEWVYYKKYR
jgi:ribosomal-protein-serine acetyltransferase